MAVVFSLLIGGARDRELPDRRRGRRPLGDRDASCRGALLGEQRGPVRFAAVSGEAAARGRVDDGDLDAAIVIPAGFGDAARAGRPAALTVLRSPDRLVSGQVAESVAASLVAHVNRVALTIRTAAAHGAVDPQMAAAAERRPPRARPRRPRAGRPRGEPRRVLRRGDVDPVPVLHDQLRPAFAAGRAPRRDARPDPRHADPAGRGRGRQVALGRRARLRRLRHRVGGHVARLRRALGRSARRAGGDRRPRSRPSAASAS